MPSDSNNAAPGRLNRLLALLDNDPNNLSLLAEAAEAALGEHMPEVAHQLFARHETIAPLSERQINQAGLAALAGGDHAAATSYFARLLQLHPSDPSLRFNQAWALAMSKRFEDALALLSDDTVEQLAQAAMLQVQLLHELGRLDEAGAVAQRHVERHSGHAGLMAAVSVLAVDTEDLALAETCARQAGDHPDALTTLGTLALREARDSEAAEMFARALKGNTNSPRAWIGAGLADLLQGSYTQASERILHGAQLFDTHIGSWIAAGWAQLMAGDIAASHASFQRALAIDENFAESHGSLAVVAILEGRIEDAKRLTEVAQRLDRQSFAAALAQSLLLQSEGKADLASRIIERALHTPIDATGATVAQIIAKRALFA